ncbi:hypothetical protein EJB05_08867, partial [Eragrostis curvula]
MAHVLQHGHQELPYPQAAPAVSLLLVCPLVVLLLVLRHSSSSTATTRAGEQLLSRLPSPPRKVPFIGHLHLLGSLQHVSLRDLANKHGRDGLMLLRFGAVPTLVVSSPSAAQAVLRTYDHVFASKPFSFNTDILFYGSTDIVFSPYGEHWRQVKKIATTHLLTNKKVRSYRLSREQEVRLVVAKINEAAAAGTAIDLSDQLNSFANDIVCHAVSGKFFREEGRNKLFRELVHSNSRLIGAFNPVDYFPILGRSDMVKKMLCAEAHKVHRVWDDLLNKLIDDHASKPVSHVDGEESDFIDVLLSAQDEYNLTRDHIKAQLVAVIKETLRLHAPAPLLVRLSMADCDIGGYTIPSGTRTIINNWALARDPDYWECAEAFMPERFMEGGRAAAMDYMGNDFMYLSFGSGRRRCPGSNFAVPLIEVMLANLMYHFNWELPPELAERGIDMTESFGVTLHRTEKLLLVPVPP